MKMVIYRDNRGKRGGEQKWSKRDGGEVILYEYVPFCVV
jgi:hypothetical protein